MNSLRLRDNTVTWLTEKLHALGIRFDSDLWELTKTSLSIADKPVVFDWPKMTGATAKYDALNAHYVEVLKRFSGTLLLGMAGRNSPATIANKVVWLRKFFRDLQFEGFESITEVGAADVTRILMKNNRSTGNLRTRTVIARVRIIKQLHNARPVTGYGFLTEPMGKKEISRATKQTRAGGYWEAPPEPLCIDLLRAAINFLDGHASNIIKVYLHYVEAVEFARASGVISNQKLYRQVAKIVGEHDFKKLLSSVEGANDWKATSTSVAKLMNHISAACFIVITFTCGPRISELRRATSVSIRSRKHEDGKEYFYYHAPRSKTRYSALSNVSDGLSAIAEPWILSPAAVNAFNTLISLTAAGRQRSGLDSLWLTTYGNALWPVNVQKGFSVLSPSRMNVRMNEFAKFADLPASDHWQGLFHSHMGRKHLARFIAKRDRSALGDLAQQYSHLSAESIDISYARPDSEFRRMVQEELHDEMAQVAQDLLGCEPSVIYPAASDSSGGRVRSFLGRLQSSRDINLLMSSGTLLLPCQWGVCLYRQETSACEGTKTQPNPVAREPDVCASCSNFIATPKHSQWWQEYRSDSIRTLAQKSVPAQLRAVLEKRLLMTNSILQVIEADHD